MNAVSLYVGEDGRKLIDEEWRNYASSARRAIVVMANRTEAGPVLMIRVYR